MTWRKQHGEKYYVRRIRVRRRRRASENATEAVDAGAMFSFAD
jgi:hypothetical protein